MLIKLKPNKKTINHYKIVKNKIIIMMIYNNQVIKIKSLREK